MPSLCRECTSWGSRGIRTGLVRNCFCVLEDWRAYQSVLVPFNGLLLVGIGVCESLNRTSVAAEKTVQVGADLVSLTLAESVALSTSCLEEPGSLLSVSCRSIIVSCNSWCLAKLEIGF
jgi:hypothetical protein